jgi:hypothetical protein
MQRVLIPRLNYGANSQAYLRRVPDYAAARDQVYVD